MRERFFTRDKAFYKKFLYLAVCIVLKDIIVCLVALADNVMIGGRSETAMAGVSLANQYQFLLQMVVNGIAEGMMVLTAQYWGSRRDEPIRRVMAIALRTVLFVCALFMLAGLVLPETLLGLLSSKPQEVSEGAAYMRIVAFSYLFFGMSSVLLTAQRSVQHVRVGIVASLMALVFNIALNYVTIYILDWGARGAAIATLAARVAEFGVALVYTLRMDKALRFRLPHLRVRDRALSEDFRRVSIPVMLSGASWGVAMLIQTAILGHMPSDTVPANAMASTLFQLVTVVSYAFGSASAVVIGERIGARGDVGLRPYVRTLQALYLLVGLLTSAALFALKEPVLALYADASPGTRELAGTFINVLCVTVVGTAYQCSCLTGIVRGGGHTKFVLYNDLIFMWGIVLPVSALAAYVWHAAPVVVFACLKSDQLLKCVVAAFEVNSNRWIRRVTREGI